MPVKRTYEVVARSKSPGSWAEEKKAVTATSAKEAAVLAFGSKVQTYGARRIHNSYIYSIVHPVWGSVSVRVKE